MLSIEEARNRAAHLRPARDQFHLINLKDRTDRNCNHTFVMDNPSTTRPFESRDLSHVEHVKQSPALWELTDSDPADDLHQTPCAIGQGQVEVLLMGDGEEANLVDQVDHIGL